jgi:hypothetical protein
MTNKFFLTLLFFFLLNFSQPIKANDLLRLFTTPDERTKLDKALEPPPRITKSIKKSKPSGPQPPRYITFNGIVKRSQGPLTIWINGQNNLKQPGFEVKLNNLTQSIVSIHLKGTKKTILLKPGQTVDTLDNTIKDNFEHSLITEKKP